MPSDHRARPTMEARRSPASGWRTFWSTVCRSLAVSLLHDLPGRLSDGRSGRVIFVSHCLLNENVRYLGGATRLGAVDELVDAAQSGGVGFCQMPCPEQVAWGGVLKRRLLLAYGADRRHPRMMRLAPWFLAYTRWRYRRLARAVANDVADYCRSGYDVVGMVGVDGSPSCGVRCTLDVPRVLDVLAACDPSAIDTATFNDRVVLTNVVPGEGLFVSALRRELRRRRLDIPLFAHDLMGELQGVVTVSPELSRALVR